MKKLLLFTAVALIFTACNKCVECDTKEEVELYNYDTGNYETYGDYIQEVCSDDFESKDDFNDYIEAIEDKYDWDCKSDFWN